MVRRLPRRSRVDTGDNLSILWMEHRWSSDGSKDNPTRLNPPPSPAIMPHVCHFISFHAGHVRAYAKTFFDKRARITKRPTKRVIAATPPFRWPFAVRGRRWTSVGQEVGARERHVLRATTNNQPTRASLTCCHASCGGGDASTWLFCKLTSAITVARRRNWRRKRWNCANWILKAYETFFQSLLIFFFFSSLQLEFELKVSKIETFETWKRGSWKFDLWWDGSFRVFFFWKFFWKENFWNIERISFLGKVFLENLKSWIEKWWI